MFYTYLHARADDGKVFYIGKGTGRRAWRDVGRSSWWRAVVRKHGWRTQVLAHWDTEPEAFAHERLLIEVFRERGAPLCNLTAGGEGRSGGRLSDESRKRISEANKGRKRTAETRARISAARTGKPLSAEHRQALSNAGRKRKDTPETVAKRAASLRAIAPKYDEEGVSRTSREWAEVLGCKAQTVVWRVKRGKTPSGR
jgi:hypothetical protein